MELLRVNGQFPCRGLRDGPTGFASGPRQTRRAVRRCSPLFVAWELVGFLRVARERRGQQHGGAASLLGFSRFTAGRRRRRAMLNFLFFLFDLITDWLIEGRDA